MMEFFEVFDLPQKLNLDLETLEHRFHALSREHHPDYHTTSSQEDRARALLTTALLNDAYRTLRDPTRRVEYLVRAHGFTIDGSKVPQSLLMEVFEINEELEQLRASRNGDDSGTAHRKNLESFGEKLRERRREYEAELGRATLAWDDLIDRGADDETRRSQLAKLADIVARSAYLRNLEREIENEVTV